MAPYLNYLREAHVVRGALVEGLGFRVEVGYLFGDSPVYRPYRMLLA